MNDVDFRGINVTSVIARAFERVVYSVFNIKDLEAYFSRSIDLEKISRSIDLEVAA